jgi:hypothetical protein
MKRPPELLFDWHAHDRSFIRMGLALLITVTAWAGMFIIFRVVTPESRPVDVRPQRVMLLNPNVPAERALIHKAMDRSFGLVPSDTDVISTVKGLKKPTFTPSYAQQQLRLKPLPSSLTTSPQTRSFAQELEILPPLPAILPTTKPQRPRPNQLHLMVEGSASTRAPQGHLIQGVPLADTTRPRFQVAIGPDGRVLMALPLSSSEDPAINQKLHHAITQLHFKPAEKELEWAQISFQWQEVTPP